MPTTPSDSPSFDASQRILVNFANLAESNSYRRLAHLAELYDLTHNAEKGTIRLLITIPLILAYLIVDDLPPARITLSQIPENLAHHAFTKALAQLVAAVWERQYPKVYIRADIVAQLSKKPDFFHVDLGKLISTMVVNFVEAFRRRTLALLNEAFTTLPFVLAQSYLGMSPEQVVPTLSRAGFDYDANTQMVTPRENRRTTKESPSGFSSLHTFQRVADSVAKLDL